MLFTDRDKELELLDNLTDQDKFMILKRLFKYNRYFDDFSDEFKNNAEEILGVDIESKYTECKRLRIFLNARTLTNSLRSIIFLEKNQEKVIYSS